MSDDPKFDIDDFDGDEDDIVSLLAEELEGKLVEGGIGHYEWHGATGYDSHSEMEMEGKSVSVRFAEDVEFITVKGKGEIKRSFEVNKRGDEESFNVDVSATLSSVVCIEGRYYGTYDVEVG